MYKSDQHHDKRIKVVESALKHNRSKNEIQSTFRNAGIIDNKGNLKKPYEKVYFPADK